MLKDLPIAKKLIYTHCAFLLVLAVGVLTFSQTEETGSNHHVLSVVIIVLITSLGIGILTYSYSLGKQITSTLNNTINTALDYGLGDFSKTVPVRSQDEIGRLAVAVNNMGYMLQKSYRDLEFRVQLRTSELAKMAEHNARFYEQAKRALHTRDEFLSVASHELKTPLAALNLQFQLMQRLLLRLPDSQEKQAIDNLGRDIDRSMKRTIRLLDDLLDLSRLSLGKLEIHRERCDLVPIVKEAVNQLIAMTPEASVIAIHAPDPTFGEFDQLRVHQAIVNLLSNALKYGDGKPIEVSVRPIEKDGRKAEVSVRDHGIGIAPEQQERIFKRFERVGNDPNITGLGLGLYIVRQIVEAHGGTISVESEPRKGSVFTILF